MNKYKKLRAFYVTMLFLSSTIEIAVGIVSIFIDNLSRAFSIVAVVSAVIFVIFTILNIINNNSELKEYQNKVDQEKKK